MNTNTIQERLFALQDEKYKAFQERLLPNVENGRIIGVRTPALRALAKDMLKSGEDIGIFMRLLPHRYFDENQLHAFLINEIRDNETCLEELERFLPYIDNWATCDQLSPKHVFRKMRKEGTLTEKVQEWLQSEKPYAVRFGIGVLMEYYLDEDWFDGVYMNWVAEVSRRRIAEEEYYVRMMVAWYFATALAKQYDAALVYIKERCLSEWCHKKAIQKARESYRLSEEAKRYLYTLA